MDCSQTYEEYCSVQTPLWKPSARDSASRLPRRSWRSSIWNQCLLDALSCLVRYCNPLSFPVGFSCMPISYCYTNVPMIDCSQTYEEHCSAQTHLWNEWADRTVRQTCVWFDWVVLGCFYFLSRFRCCGYITARRAALLFLFLSEKGSVLTEGSRSSSLSLSELLSWIGSSAFFEASV